MVNENGSIETPPQTSARWLLPITSPSVTTPSTLVGIVDPNLYDPDDSITLAMLQANQMATHPN